MTNGEQERARVIWEQGVIPGLIPDGATKDDAIWAAGVLLDSARAREAALRSAVMTLFEHAEEILGNSSEVYVLIQDMDALRLLLSAAAAPAEAGPGAGEE